MRTLDHFRSAARAGGACLLVLALMLAPAAHAKTAQKRFETPEAAADAFHAAIENNDISALKAILGSDFRRYIPPVGAEATAKFLEAWSRGHAVNSAGDGKAVLAVGTDGWTLPIPIVQTSGGWRFDTRAGAKEMRARRIGRNESAAIRVLLAIGDAQREYATRNADRDGLLQYAAKLSSSKGKQDGLYWPARAGEPESPLGPLVAQAQAATQASGKRGYHGYRYRVLTGQGPHAAGGAYDYLVGGKMIGGFGAIAWPVKYGDTGVMTFIVNHDGVVYQKDLGPGTTQAAAAIKRFDPDASWTRVQDAE